MKPKLLVAILILFSYMTTLYAQEGSVCSNAIPIALPFEVRLANTANFGDDTDVIQPDGCGAVPVNINYMAGDEVFYRYTANFSGSVRITLDPEGASSTNSSIFVYQTCENVAVNCVAGMANAHTQDRILSFNVLEAQTYIIVVSSALPTQSVIYNLLIQREDCAAMVITSHTVNPELTSATLTWVGSGGYTSFEVAVQEFGELVPQGAGTPVTGNSFNATGLNPATTYQFWVRAACLSPSGGFTAWHGPFKFNTLICADSEKCAYTFRMTDTGSNGWQGARIDVRQNGILVGTIGTDFTSGAGPVDVTLLLCDVLPFELVTNALGTQSTQTRLQVLNTFGQTVYTKPAGPLISGAELYSGHVTCDAPPCNIAPVNVIIPSEQISTSGFTIKWSALSTTSWDIYIVPAGSAAPNASTSPTYNDISAADVSNPSFTTSLPLLADTSYDVYVRVNCEPVNSAWSIVATATTLPICLKPLLPSIMAPTVTANAVSVSWQNGSASDIKWEILMVPGPVLPSAPYTPVPEDGILFVANAPAPFSITGLDPATIYYYYIRTVCSDDQKSSWSGPIKFNTITCAQEDKCIYKFVLSGSGPDGWNGGKMIVRQNGIPVYELTMTEGESITRNVPLCPDVPFDLYWNEPGTVPSDMGVSIQNPFLDVLFSKDPGSGMPLSVLYSGIADCTDVPCAKPIIMESSNVTATMATLNWEDNALPPTSLFDLYIVLSSEPAPLNDPATMPTHSGIATGYVVSGLQPSTRYTWYVRASCGGGVHSNWTILSPATFVTKPINDNATTAQTVAVNPDQECNAAFTVNGSTYGATPSLPAAAAGAGCGTVDDDVWFQFVAIGSTHMINFNNVLGTPAHVKVNHSIYSGPADAPILKYCSTALSSMATTLIPGQTYYVRAYTPGSNATQYVTFNLCITSPPANDDCANSISVPVNPDRVCSQSVSGYTLGATAGAATIEVGTGCGTADDDLWYHFTATAVIHSIEITRPDSWPFNIIMNHSVYSGSECGELTLMYCRDGNASVAVNLTIGNIYKVRIYTISSNVAEYARFNLCISTPAAVVNDECASATIITVVNGADCNPVSGSLAGATASVQSSTCLGSEDDDVWYSFIATGTFGQVLLQDFSGGNLAMSLFSGSCDELTLINCSGQAATSSTLIPGQVYTVRIWSVAAVPMDIIFDLCVFNTTPVAVNNADYTPQQIVGTLVNNPCVTVSNVTSSTGSDIGDVNGIGYFVNGGNTSFPLSSGLVLSTGDASHAGGFNNSLLSEGNANWGGDSQLEAIMLAAGYEMYSVNASSLEFDFSTPLDYISFKFVFGSEQYGQFQCNHSDAFAFLLTDFVSGITTNIALVPGTSLPVTSSTVRNSDFNLNCDSENEAYFNTYTDAVSSSVEFEPTEFNGLTHAMTASAEILPDHPYHIKFVIADNGGFAYDSAVFIEDGPFTSAPSVCSDKIILSTFIDTNENGIKDNGELSFTQGTFEYTQNNTAEVVELSSPLGEYVLYDANPANTYDFSFNVNPEQDAYYSAGTVTFNDINIAVGSGTQTLYFPIAIIQSNVDLSVSIVTTGPPQAGFTYEKKIIYKNLGMTPASGSISFAKDPVLTIITTSDPVVPTDTGFSYAFTNLAAFETKSIIVKLSIPTLPTVNMGQILSSSASIVTPDADSDLTNNMFTENEIVVAAFDPNDKSESHGPEIGFETFTQQDYLYYTIRFENEGTADAVNIRLEDVLDTKLDETSIRMVSASHDYRMQRIGNHVVWNFDYIHLPGKFEDEERSKGFVFFKIKTKPGFAIGDIVTNDAAIYFDGNPAIITNTVATEFVTTLGIPQFGSTQVLLYPNPASANVTVSLVKTNEVLKQVALYDLVGKCVSLKAHINGMQTDVDVSGLSKGIYLVEIMTESNAKQVKKLVIK